MKNSNGQALVEFVLILPVVLIILMYLIDASKIISYKTSIENDMNMIVNLYQNKEGKLPKKIGRTWYEADVNYLGGYRNSHRLIYSNDGLIFITYDSTIIIFC